MLKRDSSRPVVSPNLLAKSSDGRGKAVQYLPALQCAAGNWDWKLWCEALDISLAELSFAHEFDTDDAALHACVAGLGMVLAPPILTAREIRSGALVALPGYEPVEIGAYRYQRRSEARVVRQFCSWLDAKTQRLNQDCRATADGARSLGGLCGAAKSGVPQHDRHGFASRKADNLLW
ncbi:LysR substrate-binding domain-containing protein [Agrobacterium sp. NCPPB 925]|uniref:LysR substrate-binding domain-containing protein n=1 Tax=Agrobacterium sp. NCPPB 925 TaxID=1631629 RepID=UPI00210F59F6|nr:LysR substrate-binding domain-containing protein [Agrobacterium sp. NCPPB 925]